jgi:hypothetical protein
MNFVLQFVIQSADALWIPVALIVCHKHQKAMAALYVVCSMVMMRLMIELMASIGYPFGLIGILDAPVALRGQIVYHIFYAIFMALAYFSRETRGALLLAAALSMFFITAVVFSIVMVL